MNAHARTLARTDQAQLDRAQSLKLDLSTPGIPSEELRLAYERVRSSPAPDAWMVVEVQRHGLFLDAEGVGGLEEMRKRFLDKETLFGYLKCIRPNDAIAYVLVAYMSAKAPSMIKAKGSVASQFATSVFEVRSTPHARPGRLTVFTLPP